MYEAVARDLIGEDEVLQQKIQPVMMPLPLPVVGFWGAIV